MHLLILFINFVYCFCLCTGRLNNPNVTNLVKLLPFPTLVHQSIAAGGSEVGDPRGTGYPPAVSAIVDGLGREEVREVWQRGVVAAVEGSSGLEAVCSIKALLTILGAIYTASKVCSTLLDVE